MTSHAYYLDPAVAAGYHDEAPGLPGDVDFYLALALGAAAAGHPVLELACGTGRVAIPIAGAGVRVVGLDCSPAMLAMARERAAGIDNLRLVEADMADFDLDERFGLVFIPYRSFLLLPSVAAQKACLRCAHAHLVEGGRLALNVFNPDLGALGDWRRGRGRGALRHAGRSVGEAGAIEPWESNSFLDRQETEALRLAETLDSRGVITSRTYRRMKLRYIFRNEMEHLLALCGFEVEALYGGFAKEPFTETSPEMVWVARTVPSSQ